jgi:CRISPR-associated endonuclease/helicase Cas3
MAEDSPQSSSSTRWVETTHGILSYKELAPLLAERVLRVQQAIERAGYSQWRLSEDLLRTMHADFCADLVPDWAGKWRTVQVRVGIHEPPLPHELPLRMRDYMADLNERIATTTGDVDALPELLAFAEGRLLSIHPFLDFNGRVTRLWLWELLRRLELPPVRLAPTELSAQKAYVSALRDFDRADRQTLVGLWRGRLAGSAT